MFFVPVLDFVAGEILFRWSLDKSKLIRQFWEDYVLVVETLEENQVNIPSSTVGSVRRCAQRRHDDAQHCKAAVPLLQVHVVRPVLNRIDTLIQTAVNDTQGMSSLRFIV